MGASPETLHRYTLAILSHLALVVAWYLFVKFGEVPKFVMPSPYDTVHALLVPNYRWLEITSRSGFRPGEFSLSDGVSADPGRQITFQTLGSSPHSYRVQVGSCAQWHAYGAAPLYLTYISSQDIASIRLTP